MRVPLLFVCILLLASTHLAVAQNSLSVIDKIINFPNRFIEKINKKANTLEDKLANFSEKALAKLEKQEEKLKKKLAKKDSLAAMQVFGDVGNKYKQLRQQLTQQENNLTRYQEYLPGFDTIKTSLNFLSQNAHSLLADNQQMVELQAAMHSINGLEEKLQGAAAIRSYLKERRQQLKEQLGRFGLAKEFQKYNKQAYYYSQQIKEYQAILQDPQKRERKALELITKLPVFQKFFSEHSELAQLFPLPGGNGTAQSLAGLQTRIAVQGLLQQQMQAGGPNAIQVMQQSIQQARGQLNQLKDKINGLGGGSSDMEIPDFKHANSQKGKSIWKRLEVNTDVQNTRGSSFLPITTDLGLSVGIKLSDRNVIGIGASYKMGWGKNIRNISITHEGVSFRSYLDIKLKGSFYISGGYEQNYRNRFENVQQLRGQPDNWLPSGLVGIKKKYNIGKKYKGNMQVLVDFLYKSHAPQTQPILFRLGYGL